MNNSILFVCTGNYYRSRLAEILFNIYSEKASLSTCAYSKGLRLSKRNKGPISPYCIDYLENASIYSAQTKRYPEAFSESDFGQYQRIIAMDKTEHLPMVKAQYPAYVNKIDYWDFADDYLRSPEEVLPEIDKKIQELIATLQPK